MRNTGFVSFEYGSRDVYRRVRRGIETLRDLGEFKL
jgi:hypothetical protein